MRRRLGDSGRLVIWGILSLVLTSTDGVFSQTQDHASQLFYSSIGHDIGHVFSSPFRMSRRDAIRVMVVTGVAASFIAFLDDPFDHEFAVEKHGVFVVTDKTAEMGELYDDISSPIVLAGLSSAFFSTGLLTHNSKSLQTARLLIESYLLSGAVSTAGKMLIGRSRPFTDRGPTDFNLLKFGAGEFRSMPSGHATSVTSMMTVIAKQYPQWWISVPAYGLALSVALQRIEARNHWASDVLLGSAIGYWVGSTLTNKYRQQNRIYPYFPGAKAGVAIVF